MFKDKIKNSKIPEGSIRRNVVNTWREGRINELDYKAKHREAKRAYLKSGRSKESTRQLRKARVNRILNNGVAPYLANNVVPGGQWTTTTARGAYQRYKRKNR